LINTIITILLSIILLAYWARIVKFYYYVHVRSNKGKESKNTQDVHFSIHTRFVKKSRVWVIISCKYVGYYFLCMTVNFF